MDRQITEIRTCSKDEKFVEKRRRHVANNALILFMEKGFDATTMREIGKACDLTPGTIYNYIGSKSDILRILCMNAVEDESKGFRTIANELGKNGATQTLKKGIMLLFKGYDARRDWIMYLNRQVFLFPNEYKRTLLSGQSSTINNMVEILTYGVETGEFQIEPPMKKMIAFNIMALAQEWVLRRWYLRNHYTLEQYTNMQTEAILRQIQRREKQASKRIHKQSKR